MDAALTIERPARLAAPSPVHEARLFGPAHRAVSIGMVALVALTAFEALAVTTAMPAVADALDGLDLYALAFGAPIASGIVGMVASGRWSDLRGPAQPLRVGVAAFVVGLLIAGFAPSMTVLVAGRVVQGLGSGAISVALYVVVAQVYPEDLRPKVFAAFAGAWVVPALVGPAIAGAAVERIGWRSVFLAVPLLTIAALRAVAPVLDRTSGVAADGGAGGVVDGRVAWAAAAAVGAGVLHEAGQRRGIAAATLLVVAILLVAPAARRLLPTGTALLRRGLPTVVAVRGLASAAFIGVDVFIPLLLTEQRGFSNGAAGAVLTVGSLAWFAGSWLQGRDALGLTAVARIQAGGLLMLVGITAVATLLAAGVPAWIGITSWGLTGLGMGLVFPTLSVRTLELSGPGEEGANSSALQLGDALAMATILAIGGAVFAALHDASATTAYLAAFGLSAVLAAGVVLAAPRTAGDA